MKTNLTESAVKQISETIMQGVAVLIRETGKQVADYGQATEVIKAEIKAFLFGDEYADERYCLINRTLHERVILSSVCLGAFQKIRFN